MPVPLPAADADGHFFINKPPKDSCLMGRPKYFLLIGICSEATISLNFANLHKAMNRNELRRYGAVF